MQFFFIAKIEKYFFLLENVLIFLSQKMKIIFIGDIFGKPGRNAVKKFLPKILSRFSPDFVIANCENISGGIGIEQKNLDEISEAKIDIFTGGNHSFSKMEIWKKPPKNLLRPANFYDNSPGCGYKIFQKNNKKIGIINLLGQVFTKNFPISPFQITEKILKEWKKENLDGIFVDLHAEATSEKYAFFRFFDGQISGIFGTHTHVPTADSQISDQKTFFISDVGMSGPENSVIGVKNSVAVNNFLFPTGRKKFTAASGKGIFRGVFLETKQGKAKNFQFLQFC